MIVLLSLLFAAIATASFAPETRLGAWLRRLLIDLPAGKFNALTYRRVAVWAAILLMVLIAARVLGHDGLVISGQGLPAAFDWLATFDVAASFDIIGLVWLTAVLGRVRAVRYLARAAIIMVRRWALRSASGLLRSVNALGRRAFRPRHKSMRRGDLDDEPSLGLAFA